MDSEFHIGMKLAGHIGHLILNRPESHNALSRQMWRDIPEHLQELQQSGARLIVLEGEGASFAAGADIMELKELDSYDDAQSNWYSIAQSLNFLRTFPLPTIAAVHGPCHGGGCLLAAACDLRYASERASFSVPIARLGIALDDINLARLTALIGVGRAKELIYRARVLSSQEALSWGLVNDVFSENEFSAKLAAILNEINSNSTLSIKEAKESFERILQVESDEENDRAVLTSFLGPDFKKRIQQALKKD